MNVLQAVVYIALAEAHDTRLMGTRIPGSLTTMYEELRPTLATCDIRVRTPNIGTCLVIESDHYAALVGYVDDEFNKELCAVEDDTLKLTVRTPRAAECVQLV